MNRMERGDFVVVSIIVVAIIYLCVGCLVNL